MLSKDYIRHSNKLTYTCICGKEGCTSFSEFQKGTRCSKICTKNNKKIVEKDQDDDNEKKEHIEEKKKIFKRTTFEDVKKFFEKENCTLLSKEYVDRTQKLTYVCVCKKIGSTSFHDFKYSSTRCTDKECIKNRKILNKKLELEILEKLKEEIKNDCKEDTNTSYETEDTINSHTGYLSDDNCQELETYEDDGMFIKDYNSSEEFIDEEKYDDHKEVNGLYVNLTENELKNFTKDQMINCVKKQVVNIITNNDFLKKMVRNEVKNIMDDTDDNDLKILVRNVMRNDLKLLTEKRKLI